MKDFLLEAFPNPERRGCPGEITIKALAEDRLPANDPVRLHLASCSECYAEYRHYRQDWKESNQRPVVALPQQPTVVSVHPASRPGRLSTFWAVAASAVVICGGLVAYELERPQGIPFVQTASSSPVNANVDLFSSPTLRGGGDGDGLAPLQEVSLPATIVHMAITLPRFSQSGKYVVAVSKDRAGQQLVAKGAGDAIYTDGKVGVNVTLDLRNAKAGEYFLATVRDSDNGTYYYPLKVH
jgi:hypothetical protein